MKGHFRKTFFRTSLSCCYLLWKTRFVHSFSITLHHSSTIFCCDLPITRSEQCCRQSHRRSYATSSSAAAASALFMGVRTRGLEQRREGPTPTEGGMTLYLKAAEDQKSVGDCPFAHFVRLVLEEKGLEYELKPTPTDGKPDWLIEYYEGKMPALRHRKECYVESAVIGSYLEYFFPNPSLKTDSAAIEQKVEDVLAGFFPAVAKYLKDTQDTEETFDGLTDKLQSLEQHLESMSDTNPYLCGESFTILDCQLLPQLYHLQVGINGFKSGKPNLRVDYPKIHQYMENAMARPSFKATVYPPETVMWGWGNARE